MVRARYMHTSNATNISMSGVSLIVSLKFYMTSLHVSFCTAVKMNFDNIEVPALPVKQPGKSCYLLV